MRQPANDRETLYDGRGARQDGTRAHQQATIDVPSLAPTESPQVGEPVTIRAELLNNFAGSATFTVVWIFNGQEVEVQQISAMASGERLTVETQVTPSIPENEICLEFRNIFIGLDPREPIGPVCAPFTAESANGNGQQNGTGIGQQELLLGLGLIGVGWFVIRRQ